MTGTIYRLTFPSNKVYIGQTINLKKRISQYRRGHCKQQRKLFNALVKYGFYNIKIDILHEVEIIDNNIDIINSLEKLEIKNHNSIENGYNIFEGGKNSIHSDETKLRISMSKKGVKMPIESVRRGAIARTGLKRTDETKRKLSEIKIGKNNTLYGKNGINHPKSRKIIILDRATLLEINKFDSITDAANYFGISISSIANVLSGLSKSFMNKKYKAIYC